MRQTQQISNNKPIIAIKQKEKEEVGKINRKEITYLNDEIQRQQFAELNRWLLSQKIGIHRHR